MRFAVRLALAALALPLAYLAATVAGALIPGPGPDLSGPQAHTIGLIQGPLHTDILLPLTPAIRAALALPKPRGCP